MSALLKTCLLALLCLLSATAEEPVTLEHCLQLAQAHRPEPRLAQARLRQAELAYDSADALPSAQLGVGSWQGRGDTLLNANYIAQNRGDYYVFMQQQFRPPGQSASRKELARFELESLRGEVQMGRLRRQQEVRDAFYQVVAAQQLSDLSQESLHLAEELLRIARLRVRAGTSPRMDELNATIQRNRAEQDLRLARRQLSQSRALLGPLIGRPAVNELICQGELARLPQLAPYADLAAQAQQHPKLQAARAQLEASRQQLKVAQQQGGPVPGILGVYDLARPSYAVQLTLSIPLDWGELGSEVDQRRAAEEQRLHQLEAEILALEVEVARNYQACISAGEELASYREQILAPAEELVKVTRYGYERGALPYLQLVTVQQQLSSLRRDFVQRQLEGQLAFSALQTALGREAGQFDAAVPHTEPPTR